jgi:ABC-type bacteriocin/lantibiotic exporter with double-glycine peptidase domain
MQSNLVFLVNKLLIANTIYIDQEELALQISSHPSYPSLHAITGVLSHFGIANMAFEVPVSADIISELPTSFIAHFQNKEAQEDFVLVEIKKDKVLITNATNKKEKLTIAEFLSRWKGILVVVEKDTSIKTASKPNTWKQLPIVLLLVVALYALATTLFMTVPNAIYILLMAVGTYISYLIIKHELGFNSQAIDSVCNGRE